MRDWLVVGLLLLMFAEGYLFGYSSAYEKWRRWAEEFIRRFKSGA